MKVTAIVRTYKRVDYLKECLASISCQSYENWELIVFDDSGELDLHESVNLFKKHHPDKRVVYITSFTAYDLFMKSFFYQGLLSEGDIIFRIDDDDILPSYTFDKLVKIYSDNENIDFSFGSCCTFDDISKKVSNIIYNKSPLEFKNKSAWAPYTISNNNPWSEPFHWIDNYYDEAIPYTSIIHASKGNEMCLLQSYSFRKKSIKSEDLDKILLPLSTLCDDLEFLGSLEYLGLTYAVVKNILTLTRNHYNLKITNVDQTAQSGLNWFDELCRVRDKVDCLRPNDFITSNLIIGDEDQNKDTLQVTLDNTFNNINKKVKSIWKTKTTKKS
jgi:glycosyltransferase involved in cell wall biosynthesis